MIGVTPSSRGRRMDGEAGLLPLINMVFLLLAFFLIAGQLTPAAPFAVTPPEQTGAPVERSAPAIIHIARDGALAINGARIQPGAIGPAIDALEAPAGTDIRVVADAETDASRVIALLERLRERGIEAAHLVTRQP